MNMTCIVLICAGLFIQSPSAAPESWADRQMPAQEGLFLWLDASRQVAASEANGEGIPSHGQPLGVWYDASGNRRHLVQRHGSSQPTWLAQSDHFAVRFDGKDDCLERVGLNVSRAAWTIVMVVSPQSNLGSFRGLMALSATGKRDYTDGLNIDLGPFPGTAFDTLNVEGRGFGGFKDLMDRSLPLAKFRVIEVVVDPEEKRVAAVVDGEKAGQREGSGQELEIDEITLGARFYSNEPKPDYLQGFFQGDVAEVLVYDRAVSESERRLLRTYLNAKHAGLDEAIGPGGGVRHAALQPPAEPLAVQTFVPGFTARKLPLDLLNINNVKYRADGVLVALGYNGDIHLLDDTDGDGLEDRSRLFWKNRGEFRGPIGMALTPPGFRLGQGVFVPSKGKLSLVVDDDGDDHGDREVIVAEGWQEIAQAVDTLGVALDREGAVYFGLGTEDYTNGHLVDSEGKSHYDVKKERGAIVRIAPDGGSRELVATGIRFPVGLAFNSEGDLFCTDQEGATWLPNGNPFDELLHIRERRHYGFPPRHSKHLPDVIDEPSVFDYAPQHQSTCGLNFNESCNGGPVFGPSDWRGDAIVTGYSRGKIYRTKLFKEKGEYLARNQLFACLDKLTVDACVAPDGSLVVATHSGGPDWGSGPDGAGTLYKISYTDCDAPQPVFAWSSGPQEVRVAFDRPIEASRLSGALANSAIERGRAVAAGDRFETLRPGYAVVAAQIASPREEVAVQSLGLTPDGRTMVLGTSESTEALPYALTIPDFQSRAGTTQSGLPRQAAIDLGYSMNGVQARLLSMRGEERWSGWLPHLDLKAAKEFTKGSADHDELWRLLEEDGVLELRTQLDLWSFLRPRVQPGAEVADRLPAEKVKFTLVGSSGTLVIEPAAGVSYRGDGAILSASVEIEPAPDKWLPIAVSIPTGESAWLDFNISTEEDNRGRLLGLHRLFVPWAKPAGSGGESSVRVARVIEGDPVRGQEIFQSERALCNRCHLVRGVGGKVGPDLSNLVERDPESVLRDIRKPSYALNPDYIRYSVVLVDGRVLDGTLRSEGGALILGDKDGRETRVEKGEIEEMKSSTLSVMPEGLTDRLTGEELRDLLAFLLTPPAPPQ
jgi:putative heme-binding domain-containing protein